MSLAAVVRTAAATAFLAAFATVSGLALQTVVAEDRAQHQLIEQLSARVNQLERALADQEARLEKLEDKKKPSPTVRPGRPDPALTYAVPVGDSPTRGPADAPVTIVEFVDLQCPFCKRAQATLDQIAEHYGNNVRVVYKHMPLAFHKRAMPAARALECAGEQGAFWPMERLLWEDTRALEDRDLDEKAKQVPGLRHAEWSRCYARGGEPSAVTTDTAVAKRFGVRGTPSFFVNGRFVSGARPFDSFRALIDEELAKARASDVPSRDYYRVAVEKRGVGGV